MKIIELHIIQSFPVTCLNRDDLGTPKSAVFGGVPRARVSSQCWKRPTRELAREYAPKLFAGIRTKLVGEQVRGIAREEGVREENVEAFVKVILSVLGKGKEDDSVATLLYFSPGSMRHVVRELITSGSVTDEIAAELVGADVKKADKALKALEKSAKGILKGLGEKVDDAADIALFGRMVADDATQTVEGAAMFSHALSTHAVQSDIDFFSAVDDLRKGADDAGAGHIGYTEYNSACYYRYVGINVDQLQKSKLFDQQQIRVVLENFIRAVVLATPVARHNAMFGSTFPACVLALVRDKTQPLSLANAFEKPVRGSGDGLVTESIQRLEAHWKSMKQMFDLDSLEEFELKEGQGTLREMIDKVLIAALRGDE